MKPRVLSTKRLRPAQRNYLLNAGFAVVEADFIKICRLEPELDDIGESLIFTSGNAVRSVLEHPNRELLKAKDCFCVGEKTRSLLQANGFQVTASADSAAELIPRIKVFGDRKYTFFSGNLRLDTLPVSLKLAGIKFNEVRCYVTKSSPAQIPGTFDAILFFSPSGVASYLLHNQVGPAVCICIGTTTAKSLRDTGATIITANRPSIEHVIISCIKHFKPVNSAN